MSAICSVLRMILHVCSSSSCIRLVGCAIVSCVKASGRTTTHALDAIQPGIATAPRGRARSRDGALVARRGHLPGLRPELRRRERRRHRRPRRRPARLPYLRDLGVDAIWFTPWYVSPLADGGYDVADYRAIDPAFGTLERGRAADRGGPRARASGRSSTSSRTTSRTSTRGSRRRSPSAPGSPERERFWFRPGTRSRTASCRRTAGSRTSAARPGRGSRTRTARPASGTCTCSRPSSRTSTGRIPTCGASTRTSSGSGSTAASSGVRIDSAALLVKDPDAARGASRRAGPGRAPEHGPRRAARHLPRLARHRRLVPRAARPGRRDLAARRRRASPRYLRPDELHTAFNFDFLACPWDAGRAARRRSTRRSRRTRRSAPRRPGCSPTTTSPGRSPATAARTRRSPSRPSGRARRPTSTLGRGGRAPPRCWRRRCPARSTSTRATSSASTRSRTSRSTAARTRCTSAPAASTRAATAAGCRCRGRATQPPFGFSPEGAERALAAPAGDWAELTVEAQADEPALRCSRSTAPALRIRRSEAATWATRPSALARSRAGDAVLAFARGDRLRLHHQLRPGRRSRCRPAPASCSPAPRSMEVRFRRDATRLAPPRRRDQAASEARSTATGSPQWPVQRVRAGNQQTGAHERERR